MAKRKQRVPIEISIKRLIDLVEQEPGLTKREICDRLRWKPKRFVEYRKAYHDGIRGPRGGNPIVCAEDYTYWFDSRDAERHNEWISRREKAWKSEVLRLQGTLSRSEVLHPGSKGNQVIQRLAAWLRVSYADVLELSDGDIIGLVAEMDEEAA